MNCTELCPFQYLFLRAAIALNSHNQMIKPFKFTYCISAFWIKCIQPNISPVSVVFTCITPFIACMWSTLLQLSIFFLFIIFFAKIKLCHVGEITSLTEMLIKKTNHQWKKKKTFIQKYKKDKNNSITLALSIIVYAVHITKHCNWNQDALMCWC